MALTSMSQGLDNWIEAKFDEIEIKLKANQSLSPEEVAYLVEYYERKIVDEKEMSLAEGKDEGAHDAIEEYGNEIRTDALGKLRQVIKKEINDFLDRQK